MHDGKVAHPVAGYSELKGPGGGRIVGFKKFQGGDSDHDVSLPFLVLSVSSNLLGENLVETGDHESLRHRRAKTPRTPLHSGVIVNRVLGCRETFSRSVIFSCCQAQRNDVKQVKRRDMIKFPPTFWWQSGRLRL